MLVHRLLLLHVHSIEIFLESELFAVILISILDYIDDQLQLISLMIINYIYYSTDWDG